jgi:transketolase
MDALDRKGANVIRGLAIDAVQKANSGHPGMPLGFADVAWVLWTRFLKYDASRPDWPDRDRFVLSSGHASALLYSLLHVSGISITMDELQRFRQLGSPTTGHPEVGLAAGIETTTGPLGQGFANAVGMAIAEEMLRSRFGAEICSHRTFAAASDGDLMEGLCSEAASLAGHLRLGQLVVLYDDNHVTIDGSTDLAFSEDRMARFAAYGWHTQAIDGQDMEQVEAAIRCAIDDPRPSIVSCRTTIGFGSPNKAGKSSAHGSPLGPEELVRTKAALGLDPEIPFQLPAEVVARFRERDPERRATREAWEQRVAASPKAQEWSRWLDGDLSAWLSEVQMPDFAPGSAMATREASGKVINALAQVMPNLVGGSADLAGSNLTLIQGSGDVKAGDFSGRNLHFGIREHSMAAICNGMALHGGLVPYCATFLIFYDYMRPAVRLSAFMEKRVVYVYTHDSIYLGEDGPTHQPVEQLLALRSIPNMVTLRPSDPPAVAEAWRVALERRHGPTALALSRQGLPVLDHSGQVGGLRNGAYILIEATGGSPRLILMATGSEVALAVEARKVLEAGGVPVRVVDFPSWELFDAQDETWRNRVLPRNIPKVSVEAGRTLGWERYVGSDGRSVGIDRFGTSAPGKAAANFLGLTVEHVVQVARSLLR